MVAFCGLKQEENQFIVNISDGILDTCSNNYNKFVSGTTFAELKIVASKEIDILLPPLELQDKFGEIVTSYENLY